jgi:hypothetical protein
MVEGAKRILQCGGGPELPPATAAADLETLFLAELRSRRERLARLMQLVEEELQREAALPPSRSRRQCRNRATRAALSR